MDNKTLGVITVVLALELAFVTYQNVMIRRDLNQLTGILEDFKGGLASLGINL